jgi:G:T-mismatch repair DNA endonuclease (very short patch repair protein)
LKPLFPGAWRNVRLLALEVHDLALTKLERNFERDREDVQRLAQAGLLARDVLATRYRQELRPYLSREAWHDQTLQMWIESYWPS